jgi:SAM-dependent methyltransferase
MMKTTPAAALDAAELERKVKDMYTRVALDPRAEFHFEMGRPMAQRLGYTESELDGAPAEAVESFAGVGYYFDLAALRSGEHVVDLGSGSGMDSFIAAHKVGRDGQVTGIDMTDAQLAKAQRLQREYAFYTVHFRKALINETGLPSALHFCCGAWAQAPVAASACQVAECRMESVITGIWTLRQTRAGIHPDPQPTHLAFPKAARWVHPP